MAKIRGGLFSLGASGKLAKTLVYSKWKAEPYAREYVTPANPRTPAQVAQRDAVKQAIAFWQLPQLTQVIRTALNRAAGRLARTMSGANLATRSWLALRKAQEAGNIAVSGIVVYGGADAANMQAITGATATGTIGMGLSLSYASAGTALTMSGASNADGEIATTASLVVTVDISQYAFLRIVGVTTDGTTAIDLSGIVATADIATA